MKKNKPMLKDKNNDQSDNALMFKEMYKEHAGELVLDFHRVVRLAGLDLEQDSDYYWQYQCKREGQYLSSCIMGFVPLKGKIDDDAYAWLVRMWNMNVIDKFKTDD